MGARATRPGRRLADGVLLTLFALAALVALHALVRAMRERVALHVVQGGFLRIELALLVVAVVLTLAACATTLADILHRRPTAPARACGQLVIVLALAWVGLLAFAQPFQRIWFELAAGLGAGAWAGLVLASRRAQQPEARWRRRLERALVAAAATLFLFELCLRAIAAAHPAPLLARVGEAPRQLIERFRARPGELRFGFAFNSRGYYDDEPLRRAAGERLVISIGDSFNVGAVPHAYHYTTVCERELGVAVHNFGVAGVGPPEYLAMLVDDALPLDPDIVVISLFVGNDLSYAAIEAQRPHPRLRAFLERERVLAWVLPRRLARIASERARTAGAVGRVQGEGERVEGLDPESLARQFPWLADPTLEQATLSADAFLRLETERALDVCAGVPLAFDDCTRALLAMRAAAGDALLCVMIVPDEFQVEDALWEAVRAQAGVPLEREGPQALLGAWLATHGIPSLDLLPVLRAVPPLHDGRRHLYHLRDTHFNARGNRVAGEALADFLRPLLR